MICVSGSNLAAYHVAAPTYKYLKQHIASSENLLQSISW